MEAAQLVQLPLAALLVVLGGTFFSLLLTGKLRLEREVIREEILRKKAEEGEAELKAIVVSLTATVSAQGDQLGRLTTIAGTLTAAVTKGVTG